MSIEALVLSAFAAWLPHQGGDVLAAKHAIAQEIVCSDPAEPAVFGSHDRDAVMLASIARFESHLTSWVEDGSCNDPAWRAAHPKTMAVGDCDGGHAWSVYQIHVDEMGGIALVGTGWVGARYAPPGATIVHGKDLVDDPVLAARVALHMLRQNGIVGYTGETKTHHPKADVRLDAAKAFLRTVMP